MFRNIKFFLLSLYFLCFLNGFILASLLYLKHEDEYEKDLFSAIVHKISQSLTTNNKDTFLVKALNATNYLQTRRSEVFGGQEMNSIDHNLFHSATTDLMTGYGACGSYTIVLARVLKANNCRVRIAQMNVKGVWGGHILLEAETNNKWVIMDAMYNLIFRKPDGGFASFSDVHNNWEYYKKQAPANYNFDYNYKAIRYTNWHKIPVFSELAKGILNVCIGKKAADTLSIRPYVIRTYHIAFILLLAFYLPLTTYTGVKFYRVERSKKRQ